MLSERKRVVFDLYLSILRNIRGQIRGKKEDMNKVLILMSVYNGEKYLVEQIESLIHQERVDVSILVRDDGFHPMAL